MAHMITSKDSLMYCGEKPWHGIGKEVGDVLTASEALIASGLSWNVEESKIYDSEGKEITQYKAIRRQDTGDVFQVATTGYRIVQNSEAFKMFDEIVGTGMAKYEVAGSLKGGRIVWMLAKLPFDFSLMGGKDEVRSYLHLVMSHDGTLALQSYESPIRTVCWNTLNASLKQNKNSVYSRHTKNVHTNFVGKAQEVLASARQYFQNFKEASEVLAKKQMGQIEIDSFLNTLLNVDEKDPSTRSINMMSDIKQMIEVGKGANIPGVRGTAWGTFNAVAEWIDWKRSTRGEVDGRMTSSWHGSGSDLRQKAFDLLAV